MKIAFEGSDGSGKSSQVKFFEQYLKDIGVMGVMLYHEPRILRDEIFALCKQPGVDDADVSYLFGVDGYLCRKEEKDSHMSVIIRDRDTTISQYPYHHNFGTPDQMIFLMAYLLNKINGVDLVFFVDVDFDVAIQRIKARAGEKAIVDYFEKEEKLRKIHANYKELFGNPGMLHKMGIDDVRIIRINGNNDLMTVKHEIQDKFHELVKVNGGNLEFKLEEELK
jgi:thymidylate kinase